MSICYNIYAKRVKNNPILSFKLKYKIVESGCWEWQANLSKQGYGQLALGNKKVTYAHRFSYKLFIGDLPDHMFVCHKCDNRKCCNPFHLFMGTNEDNMKDASLKGRLNKYPHPSMYHYNKLKCRCNECLVMSKKYFKELYQRNKNSSAAKKDETMNDTVNKLTDKVK